MADTSLGDANYYDEKQYAGFGSRLLVMGIDSIGLLIIAISLCLPFAVLIISDNFENDPSGYFWLLYLLAVWVYLCPIKRSNFGTIGFRMLGLTLVAAKGGKPSLPNMTMRMMMGAFGPFNPMLDLLWLGADTERQTLRDCYLGTYLVKRGAVPIGRAPVHLTHYNAMGFTLSYPRVCRPRDAA